MSIRVARRLCSCDAAFVSPKISGTLEMVAIGSYLRCVLRYAVQEMLEAFGIYIHENNNDDLSKISLCSLGNCSSYFMVFLGKDVPADAKTFPKKMFQSLIEIIQKSFSRADCGWLETGCVVIHDLGGEGTQLECHLNEFLWKISMFLK